MSETKKFSRRDFLKVSSLAVGAAFLGIQAEKMAGDPHVINGLKVIKELASAEMSRDPQRILDSRKLAMVWLFAETTAKYSKEMGLGGAGLTMEHYLYGDGRPFDISFLLEKPAKTNPEAFVGVLISTAIANIRDYVSGQKKIPPEMYDRFTKMALRQMEGDTGLEVGLDAREWLSLSEENYNAFGGAKYTLRTTEATIVSRDEYLERVAFEQGLSITATDRYYWQLDFGMGLDEKAAEATGKVADTMFDQFYRSHDMAEKTLKSFGLSSEDSARIMSIYSDDNRYKFTGAVSSSMYNLVDKTNQTLIGRPDLAENDMNLLKKLGAKEFDMFGSVNIPGKIEITV